MFCPCLPLELVWIPFRSRNRKSSFARQLVSLCVSCVRVGGCQLTMIWLWKRCSIINIFWISSRHLWPRHHVCWFCSIVFHNAFNAVVRPPIMQIHGSHDARGFGTNALWWPQMFLGHNNGIIMNYLYPLVLKLTHVLMSWNPDTAVATWKLEDALLALISDT